MRCAVARLGLALLITSASASSATAQLPSARLPKPEPAPPPRAESLFAQGRLRAMEEQLYADVARKPRDPAARGALGRYLASRGRFTIAEVLFEEALRFGADTASIAQALMTIALYRPEVDRRRIVGLRLPAHERDREIARLNARGAASRATDSSFSVGATVPFIFAEDGRTLGSFSVRGSGGTMRAVIDPRVEGITVARADDPVLVPQRFGVMRDGAPLLIVDLWIGARRLTGLAARVDASLPPDEMRIGIDVLWAWRVQFDERAGTISVPAAGAVVRTPASAPGLQHVPLVLGFPGVWLIPNVGRMPVTIESAEGRALLRGARWRFEPQFATVVVER